MVCIGVGGGGVKAEEWKSKEKRGDENEMLERKGVKDEKKTSQGGWSKGDENEHQWRRCLI